MTNYVGIDLGTSNSAICSYDGEKTRLYKSPEQQFITPSVIYIDKRNRRYYGARAYGSAVYDPENAAKTFKRYMGTSTPIRIRAVNLVLTPEDCSAEILRVLFGYLPEEIRNDDITGTVITVPAAANQMQKDATLSAAKAAGIGKIAVMQEPVAAVMSVMRARKLDGKFIVYDLGGGTLDVAIAESVSGHVSLIEHGGMPICGGHDFDLAVVENVVKPWLLANFDLPDDFSSIPRYKRLLRGAEWKSELAKIALSSKDEDCISLDDTEAQTKDESGKDIYIETTLTRSILDTLIEQKVLESIAATREALKRANLSSADIERIVFVGGPTQYKPLRLRVSQELGIPGSADVDPMTAVAEGAALFAESIDWTSVSRQRKSSRGTISAGGSFKISFNYQARTPGLNSKLAVQVRGTVLPGTTFQIESLDSGWTSGRMVLVDGEIVSLPLSKNGDNRFKIFVFDPSGGPLSLDTDIVLVTRTTATIDAIPASHSIGITAKEKIGGSVFLSHLVDAGDPLPKRGQAKFHAEESLRAGGPGAIMIHLWAGSRGDLIESPYTDNRRIGTLKITGADFDEGVIAAGSELICDYEISDSGNLNLTVTVPDIQFSRDHNFYSAQEGLIDYTCAGKQIVSEGEAVLERIDKIAEKVDDDKLNQARQKVVDAIAIGDQDSDPDRCIQGMDNVLEAMRLLSKVRKDHLKEIRLIELSGPVNFFNEYVRQYAKPAEITSFENRSSVSSTIKRRIEMA
jgi:molecular chaperone DnaK